jgi:hypothetical protein
MAALRRLILLLLTASAALAGGPVTGFTATGDGAPVPADPALPGWSTLGFGYALQLDRPFHPVGGTANATSLFFNLSGQDTLGRAFPSGWVWLIVRDAKGRRVTEAPPRPWPDPMPPVWMPFPFPSGEVRQIDTPVRLVYANSETGDQDDVPLPGGLYTLEGSPHYAGPIPMQAGLPGDDWERAPGGDPAAKIPFRVYRCSRGVTNMPMRDLDRGERSGYRYGDPSFQGEDLVLRTTGAAALFLSEHLGQYDPPPLPDSVSFRTEMLIVALMGHQTSGGGPEIWIESVEEKECHVEVTVVEAWIPGPLDVITNPYHIVVVPKSQKEVLFEHLIMVP